MQNLLVRLLNMRLYNIDNLTLIEKFILEKEEINKRNNLNVVILKRLI